MYLYPPFSNQSFWTLTISKINSWGHGIADKDLKLKVYNLLE